MPKVSYLAPPRTHIFGQYQVLAWDSFPAVYASATSPAAPRARHYGAIAKVAQACR